VIPTSGPLRGCRTVTISGTNLCSQTDMSDINFVKLNGVTATVTFQNSTMIVVDAGDAEEAGVVGNGVVSVSTTSRGLLNSVSSAQTTYTYIGMFHAIIVMP